MVTVERTTDFALVRTVLTHPAIYDAMGDDLSPAAENLVLGESDVVWYLLVRDDDELLGLFVLAPQNGVCYEIHTCLLPCAWGARAVESAWRAADWIWKRVACQRLVTNVPAYNRLALRFARRAGMKEFGVNEKSFLKHGILYDQILLGMSRPEESCQHSQQ